MELILNRPLQWFVCQLHTNDLPLRHLFTHVDRTTTGPRSLIGEIRKSLAGCEKLSVVSCTPIENTLCEVTNKKDLTNPSNELITLVVFILRVGAPSWFRIKVHHSIKDGASHLLHLISSTRYSPKKYRDKIEPVSSCNAYFAAPEHMRLAMFSDERCHIRTLASRQITKASVIDPNDNCVHRFFIPAVNF
ncbi:hypothetical protein AVEN_268466-1 [Araneus ventricosus]|uniref:Uncharacterized protein n=1 Tax=Araneus ventricosus TaxID=182803 RepID=A0A4Y2JW37_ARAVE|nr:hypothetical protein AVEN_268466-1 [Araneus ventricosus]